MFKYSVIMVLLLFGCATPTEVISDRGYSSNDTAMIAPYYEKYVKRLVTTDRLQVAARADLKMIFCKCVKEIGEKCSSLKSDGIEKKQLWASARGAFEAIERVNNGQIVSIQNELQAEYCE